MFVSHHLEKNIIHTRRTLTLCHSELFVYIFHSLEAGIANAISSLKMMKNIYINENNILYIFSHSLQRRCLCNALVVENYCKSTKKDFFRSVVVNRWILKMFVAPSKLVIITGTVLLGACGFVACIVGALHWREKVSTLLVIVIGKIR